MSQNGKENYEKYKNQEILKIGVIGNANKGKSFLLSKISNINLPSGTSLKTEGLSIKYPDLKEYKDRRIVLLDSAGLETPVLISDQKIPEEKKTTLFKEKSREKLITELFLQNYIVNNCDLLLVVVDSLSYSEQKLLIKVKREIERSKKNIKLYVVHNLKTYTSKIQVEEYIKNTLKKSATFTLKEKIPVNTSKEKKTGISFSEVKRDEKEIDIVHLIYANDKSEAGEYYNQYTLDFIENSYINFNDLKTFDAIDSIKKRFMTLSDEILERTENYEKLTEKSFDNKDPNKIKLIDEKEIILKKCLIDELGFSNLKPNGFEPKYNVYEKDKKIIVNVEIPGEYNLDEDVSINNGYSIIKLGGIKEKDAIPEKLEENLYNSREFSQFYLEIELPHNLSNEKPKIMEEKGIVTFEYNLAEKRTGVHIGGKKRPSEK